MNTNPDSRQVRRWLIAASAAVIGLTGAGYSSAGDDEHHHHMTLQSATFTDGATLPLSMINTLPGANGQNSCTASGAAGGDESPQLTWRQAPHETRSFVVVAYDVTAQFTHWMMYNIPASTTSLPQNAGTAGSVYGVQILNDFFQLPNYGGPCPPTTLTPLSHTYQFTVYALDRLLPIVPTFGDFTPAGPEGLYQELIEASRDGHVLASATIAGHYAASDH
ncbi:MAG TPA: YbhB/YbcL family Raf kinase inhibitor-like protein [Steroidobacteraceae bacterium]